MSTPWFVVKYMPDLYRREPRNVGVVLLHQGHGFTRFLGQDPSSGELIPEWPDQRVWPEQQAPPVQTYRSWIDYFSHHAAQGTWERALDILSRQPLDNFYVEEGGKYERGVGDPRSLLDELFRQLVDSGLGLGGTSGVAGEGNVQTLVKQVFEAARIDRKVQLRPDYPVQVEGRRGAVQETVKFHYRYVNGVVTLMERVSLYQAKRNRNLQQVRDLLYRIEHVTEAHDVSRFIALYYVPGLEPAAAQEAVSRELHLLETYADVVDVSDVATAATELRECLALGR